MPLRTHASATISGTVRSTQTAVASGFVTAERYESGAWELYFGVTIGADGTYSMPVDAASYRVCTGGADVGTIRQCFDHKDHGALADDQPYDPVAPAEGENRTHTDFDLLAGGAISGTLHDAHTGQPLANAHARLLVYDRNGAVLDSGGFFTDANGAYRVSGIPDGTFYIGIDAGGAFADGEQIFPDIVCGDICPPATIGQAIVVAGGSEIANIDFTLHPDVIVSGRVTDAQSGLGVSGARVEAYVWIGWLGIGLRYETISDDSGAYELYANGGDSYYFAVETQAPLIDQVYPGIACIPKSCVFDGDLVPAMSGVPIQGIDFALEHGAAIAGRVVDARTGQPLQASIQLYDAQFGSLWSGSGDADGTYRTPAWTAGTFYVEALTFAPWACAFYDSRTCPPDGDPVSADATPIVVATDEIRSDIDFRFDVDTVFANGFES